MTPVTFSCSIRLLPSGDHAAWTERHGLLAGLAARSCGRSANARSLNIERLPRSPQPIGEPEADARCRREDAGAVWQFVAIESER